MLALGATDVVFIFGSGISDGNTYVISRVMGHKIVPDLSADRYGSFSMFAEMVNLATKPWSRDYGLVARLSI